MTEREALEGLEHGGRLARARRRFPEAPDPFLDLSTGINPVSYPIPPLPPEAWTRLPEPEDLERLQAAAASAHGAADPAMVVAAPGTQLLISLLPHILPHARVTVLSPTYGEHAAAWSAVGARVTEAGTLEDMAGAGAAVVCNPNNPDGARHAPAALLQLARTTGLLVVDEAFIDLEPDPPSLVPHLLDDRIIVLRSFGKSFGLAGVRLGFALAAPALAGRIRAALGPWAVSGPAIAIGTRALSDRAWTLAAAVRRRADATRLDAMLMQAGFTVIGGTCLFRLASSKEAPRWFERLARAGILTRRFPEQPDWLRFGLPGDAGAWERLEGALR